MRVSAYYTHILHDVVKRNLPKIVDKYETKEKVDRIV